MPKQVPHDELDTNAVLKRGIAAPIALAVRRGAGERIFL